MKEVLALGGLAALIAFAVFAIRAGRVKPDGTKNKTTINPVDQSLGSD